MTTPRDFHANGVAFPDMERGDINRLLTRIPDEGTLHLAVLHQPYLDLITAGIKTIESRFNTKRAAPFGKVAVGDLVLLKESGKFIEGYFFASDVVSVDLRETPIEEVRRIYGEGIQAQNEDQFWRERAFSHYATLIGIGERGALAPVMMDKKDQRGWVSFERSKD